MKSEFKFYTAPDNDNLKFYKLHDLGNVFTYICTLEEYQEGEH